ncbi:M15 family metallopeptidase [Myxacorys almedinensis]|uniref:D-alanyl-D-alanine carboxypeptidase family protein n=1 Tax=Myxacorys almedinensis A TaxID=2690445 RepID=A0A8J7Z0Q2_9CYAN|nr:M15 family metallopeptidase [Myxacorys almedinensis]NDJ16975.1 D-alanyl-D-alanine carboxypeptidase family protein [Myxacorys almedinensis A]
MNNTGLPGKPPKNSSPSFDDIPVAERETVEAPPKPRRNLVGLIGGVGAIALAVGGFSAYQVYRSSQPPIAASPSAPASPSASPTDGRLLNHYPYEEAPQSELEPIGDDGDMKLRSSAAKAYREMVTAAAAEEVVLVPLSAFRSVAQQEDIYFGVRAERNQSLEQRAEVSAPPGHSEHHTGYAIDIGDGNTPATHLSPTFEETAAYQWLQANAARFSFELSFPKDNQQGVSYEPWHWRFVGDQQSLETFYKTGREQPAANAEQGNESRPPSPTRSASQENLQDASEAR